MDSKLLELLVCPITKGPLAYDRDKQELTSHSARLAYPVRDGCSRTSRSDSSPLNKVSVDP